MVNRMMTWPAQSNSILDNERKIAPLGKFDYVMRCKFAAALPAQLTRPIIASKDRLSPCAVFSRATKDVRLCGFAALPEMGLLTFLSGRDGLVVAGSRTVLYGAVISLIPNEPTSAGLAGKGGLAFTLGGTWIAEPSAFGYWLFALSASLRERGEEKLHLLIRLPRGFALQSRLTAFCCRRNERAGKTAILSLRVVAVEFLSALQALIPARVTVIRIAITSHSGPVITRHAFARAVAFLIVVVGFYREWFCAISAIFGKLRHVEPLVRRIRFRQAPGVLSARAGASFSTSPLYHKSASHIAQSSIKSGTQEVLCSLAGILATRLNTLTLAMPSVTDAVRMSFTTPTSGTGIGIRESIVLTPGCGIGVKVFAIGGHITEWCAVGGVGRSAPFLVFGFTDTITTCRFKQRPVNGRLSPSQALELDALRRAGALVVIARSVDDVKETLRLKKTSLATIREIETTLKKGVKAEQWR